MANPNLKPSDRAVIAAVIDPVSSSTAKSSGWISMATFHDIQAIIQVGAIGASATVDAKLEQAKDGSGTGVKDISGKAITQLTKTGTDDNKQAVINCWADELDVNNGYTHVRLTITPATAASLIAGVILGHDARYQPADAAATVDEVV